MKLTVRINKNVIINYFQNEERVQRFSQTFSDEYQDIKNPLLTTNFKKEFNYIKLLPIGVTLATV